MNTSNMASQDPTYRMRYTRGVLQKSPHGHEWSAIEPLGILGSEVASESKMEELQMDSNQNQRRREIQESRWHSAARCGSE